ncbi:hypothetical protein UCRPC4_g00410 [Phaeomoniella chlamydospora]|uniref:Ribonuclease H2 subunit B n=1 Tax=Phaeomoniella chlamydospora TaxID=158046 RepID=A0A0G2HJT8_PHACM|nr:hypothetical protein UCRPC4_g00410 [Phaeomoniella chlamydospora]
MPRQTRSSAADSPVKAAPPSPANPIKHAAPLSFILPRGTSQTSDCRFLLLRDPSHGEERRYFFDPSLGLHELTKVSVPSIDPRSTLFAPHEFGSELPANCNAVTRAETNIASGHTISKADVLVATPVDITFHLLPILSSSLARSRRDTGKGLFLSLDDLFDDVEDKNKHLQYIIRNEAFRPALEKQLQSICDAVDAGDEQMFRLNEDKVLLMILKKSQRLVERGLPASMEEKFVTKALEVPVLSVKREESSLSITPGTPASGIESIDTSDSTDSQTTATSTSFVSEASSVTTLDVAVEDNIPGGIRDLLRLRTALSFISSSYLSQEISSTIEQKVAAKDSPVDFKPLNDHLTHLANLRSEATASRSFGDFSRKRNNLEDEDAAELRAEKKRRLEEEEKKKKAGMSRGVRDLKKVDISGMKKMSAFFTQKPAGATKAKT